MLKSRITTYQIIILFSIIPILISSCDNKRKETRSSIETGTTIEKDSLSSNLNSSNNDSINTKTQNNSTNTTNASGGIIVGYFDDADQGDDNGYISIIDSSKNTFSFTIGDEVKISEAEWDKMLKGKYKNKKIKVTWEMRKTYIPSINEYRNFETATRIEFLD